jgi:cell division protein FtsW
MSQLYMEMPGRKIWSDHVLAASVIALTGVGLVTLFSASGAYSRLVAELARTAGVEGAKRNLTFFEEQLFNAFVGLCCFAAASFIPVRTIRALVPAAVVIAALLCLLAVIPGIGDARKGASRWISIGVLGYQPSELVKLAAPLYLAHIFDRKQDALDSLARGILPPVLVLGMFFFLICLQNNLSTALFVVLNGLLIFFLAGVKLRYFLAAPVIITPVLAFIVLIRPHTLARLVSFFRIAADPLGADYQANASILSIASGGLWGKGLGQGTRKISSVPEIHSDFIFSAYTEETGFIGVVFFFALFLVFALRGYRAALAQEDLFRRLLGFSLVTSITTQMLINIAVVSGLLPVTGMPLPFFSHGGSSLVTSLVMAGLLVNISRSPAKRRFDGGEALYVV